MAVWMDGWMVMVKGVKFTCSRVNNNVLMFFETHGFMEGIGKLNKKRKGKLQPEKALHLSINYLYKQCIKTHQRLARRLSQADDSNWLSILDVAVLTVHAHVGLVLGGLENGPSRSDFFPRGCFG